MKKLLSLTLSLIMAVSTFIALGLNANAEELHPGGVLIEEGETVIFGDYKCLVTPDNTVKIKEYLGSGSVVDVPSEFDGKPVTTIGSFAFNNCSITDITIPEGVTSIGLDAFGGCGLLRSIMIPDSVTYIGNSAFNNCSSLTEITIPKGITRIEFDTFDDCVNLTSVTIPESVTEICQMAFESCSSLTEIAIPNSVTTIGDYAFEGCHNLKSLTFSAAIESIGYLVFRGCDALTEINVDENNEYYTSVDGILFNKDKTELLCYPESKAGTSYTIPDSVTKIYDGAFEGCTNLTSVTIPDSVAEMGRYTFQQCTNLKEITLSKNITMVDCAVFSGCQLTDVTIPDSVTKINDGAFSYCPTLKSLTIPASVTSIDENVFGYNDIARRHDDLTIYCYKNTAGEQFAIDNEIKYVILDEDETTSEEDETTFEEDTTTVKGDLNGDGKVDIIDLVITRAHIVGVKRLNESEIKIADLNDDGEINIADLVAYRAIITQKNYEFSSDEYKLDIIPQLVIEYEREDHYYDYDDCEYYDYGDYDCVIYSHVNNEYSDYNGVVTISTKNFPDNVYGLQYTLSTDGVFNIEKGHLPYGWAETYPKITENTLTVVCDCDFYEPLQDQVILTLYDQYEPVTVEDIKLVVLGDDGYLHLIDNILPQATGDLNDDGTLDIVDVVYARKYIIGDVVPASDVLDFATDPEQAYNEYFESLKGQYVIRISGGIYDGHYSKPIKLNLSSIDMNGDDTVDIIDIAMMRSAIVG